MILTLSQKGLCNPEYSRGSKTERRSKTELFKVQFSNVFLFESLVFEWCEPFKIRTMVSLDYFK